MALTAAIVFTLFSQISVISRFSAFITFLVSVQKAQTDPQANSRRSFQSTTADISLVPFVVVHSDAAANDLLELRDFDFVEAVGFDSLWKQSGVVTSDLTVISRQTFCSCAPSMSEVLIPPARPLDLTLKPAACQHDTGLSGCINMGGQRLRDGGKKLSGRPYWGHFRTAGSWSVPLQSLSLNRSMQEQHAGMKSGSFSKRYHGECVPMAAELPVLSQS